MNAPTQISIAPLTSMVKKIIIANVLIWVLGVLIIQKFLPEPYLFQWFGLVPAKLISHYTIWSLWTSMFLHSYDVFHILFNMILLWWMGGELENFWGSKFFLTYYTVCGVGSALFYSVGVFSYSLITGDNSILHTPVIGASGAIFGLILAYGWIYSERIIYFFMVFPMKAKYFVLIIGLIELVTLLNSGFSSKEATLAHLMGIVVGFLFLRYKSKLQFKRKKQRMRRHKLKLVVDNENKPKLWH